MVVDNGIAVTVPSTLVLPVISAPMSGLSWINWIGGCCSCTCTVVGPTDNNDASNLAVSTSARFLTNTCRKLGALSGCDGNKIVAAECCDVFRIANAVVACLDVNENELVRRSTVASAINVTMTNVVAWSMVLIFDRGCQKRTNQTRFSQRELKIYLHLAICSFPGSLNYSTGSNSLREP